MSESAGSELQPPAVPNRDVCLVLIHGIGNVSAGAVIHSAAAGIRRSLPDVQTVDSSSSTTTSRAYIETMRLRWNSVGIEIIEFNWTGIAGKIRLRRPLQALWRLMETLREAPSLAIGAGSSRIARGVAVLAGWFQWLLLGCTALLVAGSILEILADPTPVACEITYAGPGRTNASCPPPLTSNIIQGWTDDLPPSSHFLSASLSWPFPITFSWLVITTFVFVPIFALSLGRMLLRLKHPRPWLVLASMLFANAILTALAVLVGFLVHGVVLITIQYTHVGVLEGHIGYGELLVLTVFSLALCYLSGCSSIRPISFATSSTTSARRPEERRATALICEATCRSCLRTCCSAPPLV